MSYELDDTFTEKKEIYESEVKVNKVTHTWVVDPRMPNVKCQKYVLQTSDKFWIIKFIFPNKLNDYFGITIHMLIAFCPKLKGYLKCSLFTGKGELIKTKTTPVQDIKPLTDYGFEKFIRKRHIFCLPEEETFKIVSEIHLMHNDFIFPAQQEIKQKQYIDKEIHQNFLSLLKNETYSDVNLSVDGKTFRLHKAILSARSEVFAAMFKHDMKEKDTNCVEIMEMKHEVFSEMVNFIYTGQEPNCEEFTIDLLSAADKYALKGLKTMCERKLRGNLSFETCAQTLILADLHNSKDLKSYTIEFIRRHADEVMDTESWKILKKSHKHLINDVYGRESEIDTSDDSE